MTFYVLETNPNPPRGEKIIRRNQRDYSAFSSNLRTIKKAQDFLRRNGLFWQGRGKKLMLFDSLRNYLGYAKADMLVLSKSVFDAEERERLTA